MKVLCTKAMYRFFEKQFVLSKIFWFQQKSSTRNYPRRFLRRYSIWHSLQTRTRMVKSSKNSPDKSQSKKRPRRPKLNSKKQQLPPAKAKVFSDIMNELLLNIVVVEPTACETSVGTDKACGSNPTAPSMSKTPVEPERTQTKLANVENEDQFISETISTKFAFLFRVIEKLIRKGGLLAKKLWQQVERWILAMVKCVVMEVTESARICFDKIIPVRLIQQFQVSLRICDEVRNAEETGTESVILRGQETKLKEPEKRLQIFAEVSQEALEVSIPKDSLTPPNSSLSPAPFLLSTILSRCKTAFEPRSIQLPTMFSITKGGAKLARPIIKVDAAADTYDIELAPKPFLYHYVSNVTANCCKTGISLFKCKSPVK